MESLDPNKSRMECGASICGNKQHIKEKKTIYCNEKWELHFKCLFDLIFTSHQQYFSYIGTGLLGLNQY